MRIYICVFVILLITSGCSSQQENNQVKQQIMDSIPEKARISVPNSVTAVDAVTLFSINITNIYDQPHTYRVTITPVINSISQHAELAQLQWDANLISLQAFATISIPITYNRPQEKNIQSYLVIVTDTATNNIYAKKSFIVDSQ